MDSIDEFFEYGVSLLKRLISIPSVSPSGEGYREIANLLADEMKRIGFNVRIVEVPREYQERNCRNAGSNPRYIVYAFYGDGIRLHFNGHYDVVPGGHGWRITDPFKPKIVNGRLYGRGAIDMKGGIAAVIAALHALKNTIGFPQNLRIETAFVPDEEIGGECGTGYLVSNVLESPPEYVVIPEPSGLETPWHGHKGALWATITVKGINAHASTPWLGENAFLRASKLALDLHSKYTSILAMRKTRHPIDPPEAASPTIMIGGVAHVPGGGKTNQIPGEFVFTIDRRLIPEESVSQAKWELESLLRWISVENGRISYSIEYTNSMEPAINDPGPIYEALREAAETVGITIKEPHLCPGGLDMWYYTTRGSKAISYGPSGKTAHAPDEYISLDEFKKLIRIFYLLPWKLSKIIS